MSRSLSIFERALALHSPAPAPSVPLGGMGKSLSGPHRKSFDAAGLNRLTSDWQVSRLSADAELQGKLPIIRARARDHERNEPLAASYYHLLENNVVGEDGFRLEMKVVLSETIDPVSGTLTQVLDHVGNHYLQQLWARFCLPENFLVTRDLHAVEAEKLILRSWERDGDVIVRKIWGAPNEFGFALQLLEADYLDDQFIEFRAAPCQCPQELKLPNGEPFPYCQSGRHEVRMGVELHGDWGFPVAYWLLAAHPGDYFYGNQYATRRIRVPVGEIVHVYTKTRIGQTRGLPAMIAAMLQLQMRGGMMEAALVRARCAAQKLGVLSKEIPDGYDVDEEYLERWGGVVEGAPGEFIELPAGFKLDSIDWKAPDGDYAPFQNCADRDIASANGVAAHALTGNLAEVNFSTARIGERQMNDTMRGKQGRFIRHVLDPVFPDAIKAGMLAGLAPQLSFTRLGLYLRPEARIFHARGFPYFDPLNDVQADQTAIEAGLDTRQNSLARRGVGDFESVTAEQAREKKVRIEAGLGEDPAEVSTADNADKTDKGGKAGKSWNPDQPRDEDGKWSEAGSSFEGKLLTPEERDFVENFDEEDPETWGPHGGSQVEEAHALINDTDGRVPAHPDEWPESPEKDAAQELADRREEIDVDPEHASYDEVPLEPHEQSELGDLYDALEEPEAAPGAHATAQARVKELLGKAKGNIRTQRAAMKEQIGQHREALRAGVAAASTLVKAAGAKASAAHAALSPFREVEDDEIHPEEVEMEPHERAHLEDLQRQLAGLLRGVKDRRAGAVKSFAGRPAVKALVAQAAELLCAVKARRMGELGARKKSKVKSLSGDLPGGAHWVTIDGAHVLIDGAGQAHGGREAIGNVITQTASAAAHAASETAAKAPSRENHSAAAAAHTAAASIHERERQMVPAHDADLALSAEAHRNHAAAHGKQARRAAPPAAKPAPAIQPLPSPPKTFEERVNEIAAQAPASERYGEGKVRLAHVFERAQAAGLVGARGEFDRRMLAGLRAGQLGMTKADFYLPKDQERLTGHEIEDGGDRFHFVTPPSHR